MDTQEYGSAELISEAHRDIQRILSGDLPQPNPSATTAYMQVFVDFLRDKGEAIKDVKTVQLLRGYMELLEPIVIDNMAKIATKQTAQEGNLDKLSQKEVEQSTQLPEEETELAGEDVIET